jgi:hypothetical protein
MDLIGAIRDGGDLERIRSLIVRGADVNYKEDFDYTPLFWAVHHNRLYISWLLLNQGANVNDYDKYGNTPLMYVSAYDSKIEIIKLLLIRGADINHKNNAGDTALDYPLFNSLNYKLLCWRGAKFGRYSFKITKLREIEGLLLLVYLAIIPRDIIRDIHTKWLS